MSNITDLGLDLDSLFQPAWAQGKSQPNKFEKFTGNEGVKPERAFSSKPGERRSPRRDGAGGGFGGGGGERRGGPPRGGSKFGDRKGGFRGGDRHDERRERPEPPLPLPEFNVAFIPEERGVEQLARQIKVTGRAYPLFQIALLILQKAERYSVQLTAKKKADGTTEKLFVCALDETPWTSEDEAVAHVLKNHFATFYQAERTATEPPKGKYTFVAQSGMSGVIQGPPNHHDYQNALRKLHAERFSRMPFDAYKARVKIVRDEEVVKKWVDDQSWKTDYVCLNLPEAVRLDGMPAVEKHFRETHKDNIIKQVDTCTLNGAVARALRSPALSRLVRSGWEDQRRFPLQIATVLSQQFAGHGLQFFKVNKTLTHVSVARPHYLDLAQTPVSEGIRHIVEYINAHLKCNRREMIEALAPSPAPAAVIPVPGEAQPAAPSEGAQATPEQTAVISDLHWLVHEGHVIEFANGLLETAKKPLPKPAKPEGKPAGKPAAPAAEAATAPSAGTAEPEALAAPAPIADAPVQKIVPPVDELPAVEPEKPAVPAPVADASPDTASENATAPLAGPVEPPS